MSFEKWLVLAAAIATVVSLFLLLGFKLFPSIEGSGQRLWGWLCTRGPLWPVARVLRVRALDRRTDVPYSRLTFRERTETEDALYERMALLTPVLERHPKWFAQAHIDSEGVEHPYNHRFLEFRIYWCLFWRGESYSKFQNTLRGWNRGRRLGLL